MTINGRYARKVWIVLGLLCLAGLLGLVAAVLLRQGWDQAAKVAGVVSILLAVAPLVVGLLRWSRRGVSTPAGPASAGLRGRTGPSQ
ncbi:MAG: hypothetical protein LC799_19340 [Actinobacteria bacterium]|nr:hypothetical protein [Actinomycetota bacterium]